MDFSVRRPRPTSHRYADLNVAGSSDSAFILRVQDQRMVWNAEGCAECLVNVLDAYLLGPQRSAKPVRKVEIRKCRIDKDRPMEGKGLKTGELCDVGAVMQANRVTKDSFEITFIAREFSLIRMTPVSSVVAITQRPLR